LSLNSGLPDNSSGHTIFSADGSSGIALSSFLVFPAFFLLGIVSLVLATGGWSFTIFRMLAGKMSGVSKDVLFIALLLLLGWINLMMVVLQTSQHHVI